jgi:hypothetical protein
MGIKGNMPSPMLPKIPVMQMLHAHYLKATNRLALLNAATATATSPAAATSSSTTAATS